MKEQWKTIKYHTKYEVSNLGRVRNKKTKRILSTNPTKAHKSPQVFLRCNLWYDKVQLTVSRLVWDAFGSVQRKENGMVLHKDKDVTNNAIDNLTLSKAAMKKGGLA